MGIHYANYDFYDISVFGGVAVYAFTGSKSFVEVRGPVPPCGAIE